MISYREHTIDIIGRFYKSSYNLKILLNNQFKKYNLQSAEHSRILVQTREILRFKSRIDWYIKKHLNSPISKLQPQLLAILEIGAYEIIFDEKTPVYASINSIVEIAKKKLNKKASGLVNAILRKISTDNWNDKPGSINDNEWYSVPNWLYNKWLKQFGKKRTIKLIEYFNITPPLSFRLNKNKIDRAQFENNISKDVSIQRIENSDRFYTVLAGGSVLKHSDSLKNGEFSFQDRASGMIVEILDPQPNEIILDVCCAPVTKTNYIAEIVGSKSRIFASDIDNDRIELAKKDSNRLGNINIRYESKDAVKSDYILANKILIDAPCTGTGTIGRRPDIKWRRKPDHLERAVRLQKSILNNICKYVKPGGELIYATCSLEDEENWQVVEAFLKFHNDFKVISIQNPLLKKYIDEKGALNIYPPIHKMDGMFAVKMMKDEN